MVRLYVTVLFLNLVLVPACNAQAQPYVMRTLGSYYSYAQAINNCGVVVGSSDSNVPCLWDSNGMHQLPGLTDDPEWSWAWGINDNGWIAGSSPSSNGTSRACIWDGGVIRELDTIGGYCYARAINSSGLVIGSTCVSDPSSSYSHACLWTPDGSIHELERMTPYYSGAEAINSHGIIVGWSNTPSGGIHASLWDAQGIHDLGTLGLNSSHAFGINDDNIVVGCSWTLDIAQHACFWDSAGIHDLGTATGDTESCANAINSFGTVVGYSSQGNYTSRACIWNDGSCTELPLLDCFSSSLALDINDHGQIVGYARDSLQRRYAVIWEPVPEPSSLLALLSGMGALIGISLRARCRLNPYISTTTT